MMTETPYQSDMTTRAQENKLLRLEVPVKSFAYHGAKLWNSLPILKTCDRRCDAKRVIKQFVDNLSFV